MASSLVQVMLSLSTVTSLNNLQVTLTFPRAEGNDNSHEGCPPFSSTCERKVSSHYLLSRWSIQQSWYIEIDPGRAIESVVLISFSIQSQKRDRILWMDTYFRWNGCCIRESILRPEEILCSVWNFDFFPTFFTIWWGNSTFGMPALNIWYLACKAIPTMTNSLQQ